MKKEKKNLEEGKCLTGKDRWLGFIEGGLAKIWKEHIEKAWDQKEKEWDQIVKANFAEDPMERLTSKEIVEPMQKMKCGKATEPS